MAREYKKYKDYTKEERDRYIRLGIRPFTTSKTTTKNIRSKDEKKGTTGTKVKRKEGTEKRAYFGPQGGSNLAKNLRPAPPPKGSRIQFPPNPANKKKNEKKTEKKKDKDSGVPIGVPAAIGATIIKAREIIKKPTPPKKVTKTTVKPKPPVVKTKPKIGTATPAQDKVKRLQAAQRKGADTGPSDADKAKAKAEKQKIRKARMGTATPAQDKVKRLQAAKAKGADTGPSQKDLDKAKAEKKKIKQQNTASQNQKNKVKKIAEEGKKKGMTKAQIRQAIKKAVPNAAKLMVTVGGRAVPIVGWGLLAYDAVRAAKYIKENPEKTKKYSLGADTMGYKRGGKVRTMRKGGKVSHYKHGQSIKRGLIKDTPSGQDLVNSIYDTI
jgi:hypothetical protein